MNGFHHLRKRARVSRGLEPFPARTVLMRAFDLLMYGVAFLAPLALVPQIVEVYSTPRPVDVSLTTWLLVAIINALWASYGIVHKDKHVFFAGILAALLDLTIVVGVLLKQ